MNYTGSGGTVTIPSTIDGLPVTSIGWRAFSDGISLTSVTIGNSVANIGDMAFLGCSSLESVTIPNSVTAIGRSAFSSCTNLTNVTIPNGVTSVKEGTFQWCTSLTNVTIPGGVTNIGSEAFSACMSLLSVTIPDRVSGTGDMAFAGCRSLTSVFFEGNAPDATLGTFGFNNQLIVYYRYGTTGWGPTFAGRPTSMSPFAPVVENPLDLGVVMGGTTVNLTAQIAGWPVPRIEFLVAEKGTVFII